MPDIRPIGSGSAEREAVSRIGSLLSPEAPTPEPESAPVEPTEAEPEAPTAEVEEPEEPAVEVEAEEPEAETNAEEADDEIEPEAPAIDPPSSWSDAEKERFAELPPEAQAIIAERESERDAHFTKRSQEIAEQRRQFEEAQLQIQAERQHFQTQLGPMLQQLGQRLQADQARVDDLLNPNSQNYDLERGMWEQRQLDQQKAEFQRAAQEHQQMQERQRQEQYQAYVRDVAAQEEALYEQFPEWRRNPDKGREELSRLREYLVNQGIKREQAAQVYQAPHILVAWKAEQYDRLMSKKPQAEQKLKQAKKPVKAGSSQKVPRKDKEVDAARRQLKGARGGRREADAFVKLLKAR